MVRSCSITSRTRIRLWRMLCVFARLSYKLTRKVTRVRLRKREPVRGILSMTQRPNILGSDEVPQPARTLLPPNRTACIRI